MHVCVSCTPRSVAVLLVFYPEHVSACSGSVCVPRFKDDVWLVILARPTCCHDLPNFVNAQRLQISLQNSTPVIDVTQ